MMALNHGCPACGASYDPKSRNCKYCGCILVLTYDVSTRLGNPRSATQAGEGAKKWREIIKHEPENGEAHFFLGLCYLNCNLREEAIPHLRKACKLIPEFADAHYTLAISLFSEKILLNSADYAELKREISYCLKIAPDFAEANGFSLFFLARESKKDDLEKIGLYERAVALCPDISTFANNLGFAYLENNDLDNASIWLEKVITSDSEFLHAYMGLASVRYKQKRFQEGIDVAQAGLLIGAVRLASKKDLAALYNNLGLNFLGLKRIKDAKKLFNKALKLDTSNKIIKNNLRMVSADIRDIRPFFKILGAIVAVIMLAAIVNSLIAALS
jgi:tetratricopeptide (TPR) repeat protein